MEAKVAATIRDVEMRYGSNDLMNERTPIFDAKDALT